MNMGVRELRNRLSRYLERVRQSAEVVVTDRGRAIAKMDPTEPARQDVGLDALEAQGLASPARTSDRNLPGELVATTAAVTPLVAEQRR